MHDRLERYADLIINFGANLQPDDSVDLLVARGEHQNRDVRDGRIQGVGAHRAAELEPVEAGQHQVEEDDVVIIELAEIEALFPEIGRVDVEALGAEHQFDALGGRRLVFDQQHAHCCFPRSRRQRA